MERVTFNEEDIRHLKELYDAGVRQMDSELGRIFSFLEKSGRAKDTIVMVTSDHGEEFMEHGRVDHFLTMYRESLQVPLLLRGPGVPAGERFDQPISLIDIAPTLLSLARLPIPKKIEGYDLSQLWEGGADLDWKGRLLFGEASGGSEHAQSFPGIYPIYRSVREGRYKLIEGRIGTEVEYELFDLNRDPDEQRDLAEMEPALLARLRVHLEARAQGEPTSPVGAAVELAPSEREELRALGYMP
jgi:arylsulfatase A-like enzyme